MYYNIIMSNIFNDTNTSVSLGERLNNLKNLSITSDNLVVYKESNTLEKTPITASGKQVINQVSLDALKTLLLDNAQEAIVYANDVNNEINFHTNTSGTPDASNLRFQIKDDRIDNKVPIYAPGAEGDKFFLDGTSKIYTSPGQTHIYSNDRQIVLWAQNEPKMVIKNNASGGIEVRASIIPDANNTYNIGADTLPTAGGGTENWFANGFFNAVYANNVLLTSDETLKEDIRDLTYGLDYIKQLKPKQYKYINNSNGRFHWGFIAQHVRELNNNDKLSVWGLRPNGKQQLNYNEFIAVLTKAVQELDDKIENNKSNSNNDNEIQLLTHLEEMNIVIENNSREIEDIKHDDKINIITGEFNLLKKQIKELKEELIKLVDKPTNGYDNLKLLIKNLNAPAKVKDDPTIKEKLNELDTKINLLYDSYDENKNIDLTDIYDRINQLEGIEHYYPQMNLEKEIEEINSKINHLNKPKEENIKLVVEETKKTNCECDDLKKTISELNSRLLCIEEQNENVDSDATQSTQIDIIVQRLTLLENENKKLKLKVSKQTTIINKLVNKLNLD